MFDLLDRLKRWFIDLVKSRVFVLMLVFIVLSTILITSSHIPSRLKTTVTMIRSKRKIKSSMRQLRK